MSHTVVFDTDSTSAEFKERCATIKTMLTHADGGGEALIARHATAIDACLARAPDARFVFIIYKSTRELLRAAEGESDAELLKIVSCSLAQGQRYMKSDMLAANEGSIDYCVLVATAVPTMPHEPAQGDRMTTHFLTCKLRDRRGKEQNENKVLLI